MREGRSEEFDHPYKLLVEDVGDDQITRDSFFAKMVKSTGEDTAQNLFQIAKEKYLNLDSPNKL